MRLGTSKCRVGDTCEFTIDLNAASDEVKVDTLEAKVRETG